MEVAIRLENIVKEFALSQERHASLKSAVLSFRKPTVRTLRALDGVTLTIGRGATVAIIGRNGSGKSTLLRIIGKVYTPTSGTVEVHGRMSTMLGFGAGFHPELTGRENIYFNGAILGLSIPELRERMDRIIEFSELGDFIDSPVRTYSNGMEMRLGFSIAVETSPDILLIDEVLAVGDADFEAKCYSRIDQFKCDGKTIVFVTHDLDAARLVASRTIWMDSGKVKADGETGETIDSYLASIPHAERPSRECE